MFSYQLQFNCTVLKRLLRKQTALMNRMICLRLSRQKNVCVCVRSSQVRTGIITCGHYNEDKRKDEKREFDFRHLSEITRRNCVMRTKHCQWWWRMQMMTLEKGHLIAGLIGGRCSDSEIRESELLWNLLVWLVKARFTTFCPLEGHPEVLSGAFLNMCLTSRGDNCYLNSIW